MEREALIEILKRHPPSRFLEEHVFDCVPHVFGGDRTLFVAWKRTLSDAVDVDPACLIVVGGAAVGNSLNPGKNLKSFDAESDIDVAVISHYHFTVAWRYLRTNSDRRMRVDTRTRIAWDEHVKKYIYWGNNRNRPTLRRFAFWIAMAQSRTVHGVHRPHERSVG
jgi:hypothetical protein